MCTLVATLKDRVKVPISKELANTLILPCIAITSVGLYDLYSTGQKRFDQNIIFIILFGVPTLVFIWLLLDKRVEFKDNNKVRKAERWLQLPFSSTSTLFIFIVASFFLVGGLAATFGDKDTASGFPLLFIGLLVIILTIIAVENSKIWFSDSSNIEDDIERIKNTPKESYPMYQDGIFSYLEKAFTIKLDKETKTISWDEITLIRAYKIDQFAYDCIVIEIHLRDTFITINDQTEGHMKFMDTAFENLSNFRKDWFPVVAFPAFETNLTTIYEKQTMED
jgi:hypothetical protein